MIRIFNIKLASTLVNMGFSVQALKPNKFNKNNTDVLFKDSDILRKVLSEDYNINLGGNNDDIQ